MTSVCVCVVSLIHLLCRLQPVGSQLVFAGLLPAAVRYHETGDPQSSSEAEAPHKDFVVGPFVLTHILEDRIGGAVAAAAAFWGSGGFTESRIPAHPQPCEARVSSTQSHARESHPASGEET